jgi:hypothetical protein
VKDETNILHKIKEGKLTGLVTSCVGTASKTRYGRKDRRKNRSDGKNEEEDISTYWMALME